MVHDKWNSEEFAYPANVPTMISNAEKRYLYWLARSVWKGAGDIVEIGPWLGGSTVCLAAGMTASGHQTRSRLHTVDNFIWREFMASRAQLPVAPGDSFERFFTENVSPYEDLIVSYAQTLPDDSVGYDPVREDSRYGEEQPIHTFQGLDNPVEILFIDGAKSWRGMAHLFTVLNSNLIPGASLFVCQDYKYWGNYWVPLMMHRLGDHVEAVHNVLKGDTVTFRLVSAIPQSLIDTFEHQLGGLSRLDSLEALDYASAELSRDGDATGALNVLLGKVGFLFHQGRFGEAAEEFKKVQRTWSLFQPTRFFDLATRMLQSELGTDVPRRLALRIASRIRRSRAKTPAPGL